MTDPQRQQPETDGEGVLRPGRWRRRLGAIGLGLLILCGAEGALRLGGYGAPAPMFTQVENGDGSRSWVTNRTAFAATFAPAVALSGQTSIPAPPPQRFAVRKAPGTYRIAVMGGSAARGFPHRDCLSFPRFLEAIINTVCEGPRVEVVNAAVAATGSYTVLERVGELVADQDADMVVVYSGHNEFYGAYGQASAVPGMRSRSLMLTRMWFGRLRLTAAARALMEAVVPEPAPPDRPQHLAQVMPARRDITLGSGIYERAHRIYAANLTAAARRARRHGADTVLCTLGSNVVDFPPLGAPDGPAGRAFREAAELDARGRSEQAADRYRLARDLDTVRWRASTPVNQAVRAAATDEGTVLADVAAYLAERSAGPAPGSDLFLEHVHLTAGGNFLVAECVARAIGNSQVGRRLGRWDWSRHVTMDEYAALNGADGLDEIMALQSAAVLQRSVLRDQQGSARRGAALIGATLSVEASLAPEVEAMWRGAGRTGILHGPDVYDQLRLFMARGYAADSRTEDARGEMRKLRRYGVWQLDNESLARSYSAEARMLLDAGRTDTAREAVRQALRLAPDLPEALEIEGEAATGRGSAAPGG